MTRASDPTGKILFLTPDTIGAGTLKSALAEQSIDLQVCTGLDAAPAETTDRPPQAVLLDTRIISHPDDIGVIASRFAAGRDSPPPLLVLAHAEDVRLRLAAMRAGAESYLTIPQDADEMAERLARLIAPRSRQPDRVLVVDDQPVAALFASRVLQSAGIVTERVGNPLEVMAALDRFAPDLVLMDLHMPGASGIELTAIIREEDRFADLPIIFLSSELDPAQQMAALRIGGDDFLAKPVAPDRLLDSVRQRLAKARRRQQRDRSRDTQDGLTKLAPREQLLRRLDRLLGRPPTAPAGKAAGAARHGQRALIHFELAGDEQALEITAAEISGRIQPGDLAARVGERSIAILIRRPDMRSAAEFAQILTNQVAHTLHTVAAKAALGSGWYPLVGGCTDSITLLSRAGKAARDALQHGHRRPLHYDALAQDSSTAADRQSATIEAIQAGRIELLFEPMVALTNLTGDRYELAPRLVVGDGERLTPSDYLPLALEAGLQGQVDRLVLAAGLDIMRERVGAGRPVQLFIHQSLATVADDDWILWLRDQINARDLIRARPVLQFEADEADRQLELAIRRARQLGRLGIKLCINGLDFNELSTRVLHAVPMTFVRISRRVVQGPETDSIPWLIQAARACGARIIATGVHGPEIIARLYGAGVDLIQGPYVQPPTPRMDFDFTGSEASENTNPPVETAT